MTMPIGLRLRRIIFSTPVLAGAGLFALYLLLGFFALPPILKWQIEKQVPQQLGHRISVKEVRFNPLALRLEVGDLALSDPEGRPMLGLKRLLADFDLRSLFDRAWTFANLTLEAPVLRFDLDKDGRHNFTALLARLRSKEPGKEAVTLPRLIVMRAALTDGHIEFSDRLLAEPLVVRIEPLHIGIDDLSTLPAQTARYRISARTAAGETLEASGELALNPVATKGKLALNGVKLGTLARALSRLVALDPPAGTLEFATVFDLALDRNGALSGSLGEAGLKVAALSLPGAGAPLMTIGTLALEQGRVDLAQRVASFARLRIADGRIAAALDAQGRLDWGGRLPAAAAPARAAGARAPAPWRFTATRAEVANVALGISDASSGRSAEIGAIALGMSASAEIGATGMRLELGRPTLSITGAQLRDGAQVLQLGKATVEAERVELTGTGGAKPGAADDRTGAQQARAGGLDLGIEQLRGTLADLHLSRGGHDFELRGARISAERLALARADGPLDLSGGGLGATLSEAVVRSGAGASPLLRLDSVTLSGGALRMHDKYASADQLAFDGGAAQIALDAQGRLNWSSLLRAGPAAASAPRAGAAAPSRAWRLALKSAQLDRFALQLADARAAPAFALGLEAVSARIADFDTGSKQPMRLELHAKAPGGGQIQAKGGVRADTAAADLSLNVTGLALAPAQTYLSRFAKLRLAAGTASAAGRLRYGGGAGAKLAYTGKIAIDHLRLEEAEPKRPFLSWDSVAAGDAVLTLQPNRLDIGELRVERPAGRLIIAADRTVNLMDVLKTRDAGGRAPRAGAARQGDDPFPVAIARVRVSDGALEFADLSLQPQFAARLHELKGVISGLGSDVNRNAVLQLEARVDKYGSAKISGRISALQPQKFTRVEVAFRNLRMTALSPYISKFAGYSIADGRLALDLKYTIRDGKLLGENRIVLRQVKLGEKVDSPSALDLPIELALALLKDAEGVIDVDLPVSGDLKDPKFDYGAIIAKAFGNLIGNIIAAPFRALGALFGGGGDKALGAIDFAPGGAALAPPERQKLEAVARALKARPGLMLVVPPTSASAPDTRALKSLAVRRDIVRRMGIALAPGEDPGPIDATNPRVQGAIEAAFSQRNAPEALAAQTRGAPGTAVPDAAAPQFHRRLIERMIENQPVPESTLDDLARRRGAAIVREITTAGGVPAARVTLGAPRAAAKADDRAVTLQLILEAAK
jgi:uncharacterized protein involved in outer membrane biogenesis